jgi:hypothetical protein
MFVKKDSTAKSGAGNGTSIAFLLPQLYFIAYNQPYDRL